MAPLGGQKVGSLWGGLEAEERTLPLPQAEAPLPRASPKGGPSALLRMVFTHDFLRIWRGSLGGGATGEGGLRSPLGDTGESLGGRRGKDRARAARPPPAIRLTPFILGRPLPRFPALLSVGTSCCALDIFLLLLPAGGKPSDQTQPAPFITRPQQLLSPPTSHPQLQPCLQGWRAPGSPAPFARLQGGAAMPPPPRLLLGKRPRSPCSKALPI